MMIPARFRAIVFAFFMALLMSGFMSLVISLFNLGWVPDIIARWLQAWAFAFAIAFPTVVVVAPMVQRLTNAVLRPD